MDEQEKIVEIWLPKVEADDRVLRESLGPCIAEYKRRKYLVAVYESGTGDFRKNVKELAIHNLHVQAERDG